LTSQGLALVRRKRLSWGRRGGEKRERVVGESREARPFRFMAEEEDAVGVPERGKRGRHEGVSVDLQKICRGMANGGGIPKRWARAKGDLNEKRVWGQRKAENRDVKRG